MAGGVHIHAGLAGQNGPVIKIINSTLGDMDTQGTFMAVDNQFSITDGWVDTLRRITSYNVCYTKLLRNQRTKTSLFRPTLYPRHQFDQD